MLNTRDAHGYPLQGYDFVPKPKDTLSELVKLLQQANERVEQLKDNVQYWKRKYENLNQEHLAFKFEDLCERCHTITDTTPPGDTITLCTNCSRDKDTTASLTLKLGKKRLNSVTGKTATKRYSSNIWRMTEEVMMVPTKEFDQLVQYYKGEITDNALLNKAGRLAAESHVILRDKSIPDSIAIKKIKPLACQRGRLTTRIRHIGPLSRNSTDVSEEEDEEEGALVKGPLETMLKQLIKNASRGTKTLKIEEEATPSTSGVKKKPPVSKAPIPPPDMELGTLLRKADILLGKDKRKGKRKNEAERLKPASGWEDWAEGKKLRRNLQRDYDSNQQDPT